MTADVAIPTSFLGLSDRDETWKPWLAALPRLIRSVLAEWRLSADGMVAAGQCAVVVPVRDDGGTPAAVKFAWPHEEQRFEHLALRAYAGNGAVRLLRADPSRGVMMLERAQPVDLTTVAVVDACEIVAGLYPRLHVPAPPQLDLLSDNCRRWSRELLDLPVRAPVPRRYVEQAASLAADFATDPGTDGTLVHTDLHYFNVLAADREPWLAIDPKPLSGDPSFEVAPLLWNRWDEVVASGDSRRAVRERFHTVVDATAFDEDRARDWVVVRELVNVLWTIHDAGSLPGGAAGAGGRLDGEDLDWITQALTVAKAVQD
jgi:streptomycin 6-kinase